MSARALEEENVRAALLLTLIALGGCDNHVTVAPAGGIEDNFFATWEVQSAAFGAFDCIQAGAATVDMDIVNADTGERFIYTFPCQDQAGTSGPVSVGSFDVLINLLDPDGAALSQVDIGTENRTTAGTIDLGHVVFRVP